jgi:predicted DNA-binding transcriptional regulator AlpA
MSIRSTALSHAEKRGRRARASADVADPQHVHDPLAMLSKNQIARLFGVSPATVVNWVKSQRLCAPTVFSPQITRWRRADIERLIVERTLQPAPRRNPHKKKAKGDADA